VSFPLYSAVPGYQTSTATLRPERGSFVISIVRTPTGNSPLLNGLYVIYLSPFYLFIFCVSAQLLAVAAYFKRKGGAKILATAFVCVIVEIIEERSLREASGQNLKQQFGHQIWFLPTIFG
jgi:hypothetical protein